MTAMDKSRVLRGLVEHEGRWIPVGDKVALLNQVEEKKASVEPVLEEEPVARSAEMYSEHETAALTRFAEALKGEETDSWKIPQTRLRNAAVAAAQATVHAPADHETPYDLYVKQAGRRKRLLFIILLALLLLGGALYFFLFRAAF